MSLRPLPLVRRLCFESSAQFQERQGVCCSCGAFLQANQFFTSRVFKVMIFSLRRNMAWQGSAPAGTTARYQSNRCTLGWGLRLDIHRCCLYSYFSLHCTALALREDRAITASSDGALRLWDLHGGCVSGPCYAQSDWRKDALVKSCQWLLMDRFASEDQSDLWPDTKTYYVCSRKTTFS